MSKSTRGKLPSFRRALKFIALFVLLVVVLLIGANLVWKYSGSGQWRLLSDENGVQIYSKKVPGDTLLQFKAHRRLPGTVMTAVASMLSFDLDDCRSYMKGCSSIKAIHTWNSKKMSQTYLYTVTAGAGLKPREFLLSQKLFLDRASQRATVDVIARPNELPRDKCCYRIEHLHNIWTYTQVGPGELDVLVTMDMDVGVPYFLIDWRMPAAIRKLFLNLPMMYNVRRHQHKNS